MQIYQTEIHSNIKQDYIYTRELLTLIDNSDIWEHQTTKNGIVSYNMLTSDNEYVTFRNDLEIEGSIINAIGAFVENDSSPAWRRFIAES